MEQKEQLELLEEETTKAVEAIQEAPAVEASQEAVEAKKEAPAVQEEAVEEKVEEEQEAPADPRVDSLKTSLKKERLEVKRLQDSIKGLLEGLIADLTQEDKDLVSELGGEQPDRQLAIFNKLKKAGKIGASQKSAQPIPAADRTRIASGEGTIGKPQGWKEADKRVSRRLKQVN